jgi:hypothetical protein
MIATDDELDRCGPPEITFRTSLMKGLRFDLRPADRAPPERHSVTFLYRRSGDVVNQAGVGSFVDGRWTNDKGKPLDPDGLYWVAMVNER